MPHNKNFKKRRLYDTKLFQPHEKMLWKNNLFRPFHWIKHTEDKYSEQVQTQMHYTGNWTVKMKSISCNLLPIYYLRTKESKKESFKLARISLSYTCTQSHICQPETPRKVIISISRSLQAFEESAEWALLSSLCDDSNMRISVVFK